MKLELNGPSLKLELDLGEVHIDPEANTFVFVEEILAIVVEGLTSPVREAVGLSILFDSITEVTAP